MDYVFGAMPSAIKARPSIPVPFKLGTLRRFIQITAPPANRRALFDVAVAGPLAGLVIAIPALLLGLRFSSVTAGSDGTVSHGLLHGATVGSSILFTVLTKLSLGDAAQYGALVQLSPLAFAGWLGLFITALNLARADDVGTYCLPHSRSGCASVERSSTSGWRPHGGGLHRFANFDADPRANASLPLGLSELCLSLPLGSLTETLVCR